MASKSPPKSKAKIDATYLTYAGVDLYPPRPEIAVSSNQLPYYETLGYVAQIKKNGTANLITVRPDGEIECMTRHGVQHRAWQLTEKSAAMFRKLPAKGWYVFVTELLHSKGGGIRDTNYIHDILVNNDNYLVGANFAIRQAMLAEIFLNGNEDETQSHYILDSNTWLARNHFKDFTKLFLSLNKHEDEGLILKNPKIALEFCGRKGSNSSWQVKCRRADISPNFTF